MLKDLKDFINKDQELDNFEKYLMIPIIIMVIINEILGVVF